MRATDQAASLRLIQGTGHAPSPRRERAIAVTGGKGGVGKSTIAVGLASAFAADGSDTLMIDADLGMADLNLLLGVAPPHSLLDALGGAPIDDVLVAAHGMHLLPAANGSFELPRWAPWPGPGPARWSTSCASGLTPSSSISPPGSATSSRRSPAPRATAWSWSTPSRCRWPTRMRA